MLTVTYLTRCLCSYILIQFVTEKIHAEKNAKMMVTSIYRIIQMMVTSNWDDGNWLDVAPFLEAIHLKYKVKKASAMLFLWK